MNVRHRFSLQRFLRGEGPQRGPIFLLQRRVYILPTKMGIYFAVLMLVMLLGAVNFNNALAYVMTFLLASVFIISILHAYRNLLHLSVDMGQPAAVFCGVSAAFPLTLDNRNQGPRYAIRLQLGREPHVTVDVPADQCLRIALPLPTRQRGRHKAPVLRIEGSFPLGLFQAWAFAQWEMNYLVYPKPDEDHPLASSPAYHQDQQGSRGMGAGDFAGLRNYHRGDSLRHVHWKAMARGQGMHSKQFAGDQAIELWLDWQDLPQLDEESRLSRLTRWVLDADAAQLSYGLRLPGRVLPVASGAAHRQQCLEALALFDTGTQVR